VSERLAGSWLDQRHYADLDPRAERALRAAGLNWHDEATAERLLQEAAGIAPEHMAVVVAHYRYHLYKHRFDAARAHAERCLRLAGDRLGFPEDYRRVAASLADFAAPDAHVRFWLFALQAYGYVLLRCGRREPGMDALRKVAALDPSDATKTRVLIEVISGTRRDREEED
jgi:hypothetical protein